MTWHDDPEPVDRCVCYSITFEELKEIAAARGLGPTDINKLAALTGACCGCGTCRPYVKLMLQTGKTRFPILPPTARFEPDQDDAR